MWLCSSTMACCACRPSVRSNRARLDRRRAMPAHAARPTVLELAEALAGGRATSRDLVEAALARIADPAGEGARTFARVYGDSARQAADAQDRLRRAGYVASPLAGLP